MRWSSTVQHHSTIRPCIRSSATRTQVEQPTTKFLCRCSPDLATSPSRLSPSPLCPASVGSLFFPATSTSLRIPFDIFWNNTRDPSTRSSDEAQVLSAPMPPCHPSSERNWNSLSTHVVASYASVRSKKPPSRLMRAVFPLVTTRVKDGSSRGLQCYCNSTSKHLHIFCQAVELCKSID